ncbi:TonB family protein [Salisaeta longa]|uniref:TonB family protein n=1 Tax=Salisaeta longa TaxID=503170 RepID=UPI00146A492C|nr:TonB family protein [Salisaeta longa]
MELAPLTVLNNQYTIKRTLGDPGPFDIKYLGQHIETEEQVIIREYFPTFLIERASGKTSVEVTGGEKEGSLYQSGIEYFQKESEVLGELSHEALPSSYDVFEANGTIYRVRPYEPSMSLARGLEDKGALSEKAALTIMVPVLKALEAAHEAGLYHGGVSPLTIRLREGGQPMVTGFRGSFIQLARQSGQLNSLVQPGTSAIEQYTPRGNQGPWTDVYAAAATICTMVTGQDMPKASDRLGDADPLLELLEDAASFSSPGVRDALTQALVVDPSKRMQEVEELRSTLEDESVRYEGDGEGEEAFEIIPVEADIAAPADDDDDASTGEIEVLSTGDSDRPSRPRRTGKRGTLRRNRTALFIVLPLVLLAAGGGAWYFTLGPGASNPVATKTYQEYRQTADSLFAEANYNQAETYYQNALNVRPEDQYTIQRLNQISELQQESSARQFQQQMDRGLRLKNKADSLAQLDQYSEANRLYSRAMAAYFRALDIRPGNQQALDMRAQIDQRQLELARQQIGGMGGGQASVGQIASFFQQQGNQQLQAGNLRVALSKFQQAANYKPNDPNLQRIINDLQQQIEQNQQQDQYQEYFSRGQQLQRQGNYAAALEAFRNAAEVQQTTEVEAAIATTDSLRQTSQAAQAQYNQYISQADAAFQQGNFETAVEMYQNALEVRPGDDYAAQQLEKSRSELEMLRLARAKQQQNKQQKEAMQGEQGIYNVVDQAPKVKGGLAALHEDVQYPQQAARQGIEGKVYVQAVVNADGTVRSAQVVRGIGGGADEEALEAVREAEFIPAKVDGKPVPAKTVVWVRFSLDN